MVRSLVVAIKFTQTYFDSLILAKQLQTAKIQGTSNKGSVGGFSLPWQVGAERNSEDVASLMSHWTVYHPMLHNVTYAALVETP